MIVTTVLRGISQELKMTITRSLEANFLTEVAAIFFLWFKVCHKNRADCHRNIRNSKKTNQELHFLRCKMPHFEGGYPPSNISLI